MNRVVICSPYAAGNIEVNLEYARDALRHSLDHGEAPFASHLLYPQVADDTNPRERYHAMQAEYEWIAVCDIVAFYVDRGWSPGMLKELKVARMLHKETTIRTLWGLHGEQPLRYPI